jgi:phosphopantothenoylcysteine decarboxylase/phosphopantothenate--cysteine ligase
MGFALAEEAAGRGASVILVTGPVKMETNHPNIKRLDVSTAGEMYTVCMKNAPGSDIIVMSAAVADYAPVHPPASKIKKQKGNLSIEVSPTKDILAELGKKKKKGQLIAGFALETDHEVHNARKKLEEKRLDLLVLNSLRDPGAGFNGPENKVTLFLRTGKVLKGELKDKKEVAADIFNALSLLIKPKTR